MKAGRAFTLLASVAFAAVGGLSGTKFALSVHSKPPPNTLRSVVYCARASAESESAPAARSQASER